jgi:hypothetical protein
MPKRLTFYSVLLVIKCDGRKLGVLPTRNGGPEGIDDIASGICEAHVSQPERGTLLSVCVFTRAKEIEDGRYCQVGTVAMSGVGTGMSDGTGYNGERNGADAAGGGIGVA